MKRQIINSYKYLNDNPRGYILNLIKKPERKHLKIEDLLDILKRQNGLCAISGIKMTFTKKTTEKHTGRAGPRNRVSTNLSIDKINPGLGYELNNIQLVCMQANLMKQDLKISELIFWCKQIYKNIEGKENSVK